MQSDNDAVKKEYNKLRSLIVKVLREIEVVRASDDPSKSTLSLDSLKLEVQEKTEKINGGLDTLIRNNEIDVQMATSLMNDISYCREICWDLVAAGSQLFSTVDRDDQSAMKSIALDEDEIIEMMETAEEG
jgi:phosphate:Na+ symporter